MALGDSFAYGVVPYPDNYLTLLESELARRGRPTEVVNMGIPGIGPPDYLSLLVAEGLDRDPDSVLVTFCLGNDFRDSLRDKAIWEYSYVATLLRFVTVVRPRVQGSNVRKREAYRDAEPTFSKRHWPDFDAAFERAVDAIGRIQRICEQRGIGLAVAVAPEEIQLDPDLQRELRQTFADYREGPLDFLRPYRLLIERLRASGIEVIDLLDAFSAQHRAGHPLYKPLDTHWNIAGNRLAAEVIAARIPAGESCSGRAPRGIH